MDNTASKAEGITVECAEKLIPILTKPKRLKIALGGRGASKSIAYADAFLHFCDKGEKLLCAREFQNSIEDSVHGLLKGRIKELDVKTLNVSATGITSNSGGEIFYKGLTKNPDSIKSTYGIDKVWIEEASTISQKTLDILLPTLREDDSEIWLSMNRGSSKDPVYKLVKPYEKIIARDGYYEDDDILIVEINYYDNPWFPDVLEKQRRRDKDLLPTAKYNHIWLGHLSDSVQNAIITPEWFDACIDAHEKLGFKAQGCEVVTHDPADSGDSKALSYRKGSVFEDIQQTEDFGVNEACDWATDYANEVQADVFNWDGVGIGISLRRDIAQAFEGKHTDIQMFNGASGPYWGDAIYEPLDGEIKSGQKPKTNKETFFNARAQSYWLLRDRMFKTWQAVVKGIYHNPDDLISINGEIKDLDNIRSEVCRIPRKTNGNGKIQLYSKEEMKRLFEIDSPNMADCMAMSLMIDEINKKMPKKTNKSYAIPTAFSAFN